jgi:mannose-1-phosphate guanylyltransferase/phosphomannomutase
MKAMILAAGQGTRLRPLTERIPKCMVLLGGKPLLEYTIEWLRRYGVTEIIINLYHLPEAIRGYFGDGQKWGVRITYSLEDRPLGTAGGVKNVERFLVVSPVEPFNGPFGSAQGKPFGSAQDKPVELHSERSRTAQGRPFFVWYGDNLSTCDLSRLYQFHQAKGSLATIALHHRDDPTQSGIAALDEDDRIVRFLEKPGSQEVFSHWVSAGIFVLEPQVLDAIPLEGTPDFGRDVFPALLTAGKPLYGYRMSGDEGLWWIDTLEDLRRVEDGIVIPG